MKRRLRWVCFALATALAGCEAHFDGDANTTLDAAPADLGVAPMDAGTPARDVPITPVDRGVARDVVDVVVARDVPRDVGTTVVDVGIPAACAGGPLAAPIAGCHPAAMASTGDPHQDCVDRINQFRRECQCLPPLQRWTDGEACADREAMFDQQTMTAHHGFSTSLCASGSGQNECPGWLGWGSVEATVSGCLQQMWDEGPGDFYGPPAHGHYLNMSSASYTRVACGFFTSGSATTAAQNFR